MAFCYITIPSLENRLTKLNLYILSAQIAYLNQSLSQGENRIVRVDLVFNFSI